MRTTRMLALGAALLGLAAAGAPAAQAADEEDTRPLFRLEDTALDSSSGLAVSADDRVLFALQDAGQQNAVFALDRTGQTRATLTLPGVRNEDWEDLSRGVDERGRPALFVSDMGDAYFTRRNAGEPTRRTYSVLRFTEPGVRVDQPPATQDAQDLVRYPVVYADRAARNSEALAVQPGSNRMYVVDKAVETVGTASVWRAPAVPSTTNDNVLDRVAQIPVAQVTAATFSPDGSVFVVRDYHYAYVWKAAGVDLAVALRDQPTVVPLPPQPQGEGLAFDTDGRHLLVSSEGKNTLVWQLALPASPHPVQAAPAVGGGNARPSPDRVALWVLGLATAGVLGLGATQWRALRVRRSSALSEVR